MEPVTAAGGVLYRRNEQDAVDVVMIYRNGVWDLPKGKQEDDELPEECARREVAEEVGIPLPDSEGYLTDTYHEYRINDTQYAKTTHWYRLQGAGFDDFTPERAEGIEKVEWVPLQEARARVGFPNLRIVLDSFTRSLETG